MTVATPEPAAVDLVEAYIVEEDGTILLDGTSGRFDIDERSYHADPVRHLGGSLSSTLARKLLAPSCPALALHAARHPVHRDYFDLGTVTHRLILGAGQAIVEIPADSWRTRAAQEARDEARACGQVPILSRDLARARKMVQAVYAQPLAASLLTRPGRPEQVLIWREGDVLCRAMFDRWPDPAAGDPVAVDVKKTAKALDDRTLQRTFWDLGYHQQAEWYSRGYHAVHGVWPAFVFVVVQDEPPHLVRVVELDDDLMADARARNDEALRVWQQCRESGVWPGYGDDIATITAPSWARTREGF